VLCGSNWIRSKSATASAAAPSSSVAAVNVHMNIRPRRLSGRGPKRYSIIAVEITSSVSLSLR
jgi:hypothetical protein